MQIFCHLPNVFMQKSSTAIRCILVAFLTTVAAALETVSYERPCSQNSALQEMLPNMHNAYNNTLRGYIAVLHIHSVCRCRQTIRLTRLQHSCTVQSVIVSWVHELAWVGYNIPLCRSLGPVYLCLASIAAIWLLSIYL